MRNVLQNHGIRGFYKGMAPALVGMGPAQAIRLTMNDYGRTHMVDKNGNLPMAHQMAAGAMGGACQTMVLNPAEVIKIRLQLNPTTTVSKVVKEAGMRGLYKGYYRMLAIKNKQKIALCLRVIMFTRHVTYNLEGNEEGRNVSHMTSVNHFDIF